MRLTKDLTVGHPFSVMLMFSLPMFVSVVFQQLYNIADSVIAGRYAGEEALAAIGASFPVTMLLMSVCFGCNIGCSIVTSKLFGAKEYDNFCTAIKTSLTTSLICSIVMSVFGIICSSGILKLLGTPDNIFLDSKAYLDIYVYGYIFLFFYNVANGIFNSMGDSVTPLIFLVCSSIGNIVLDVVFVKNMHMGVAGAAWATFIAQGVAGILSMIVLITRIYKLFNKEFKAAKWFDKPSFSMLVKISIPSVLQQAFISVGNLIIQSLVNGFASSVVAGYTAGTKINAFAIVSSVTLGNSMSTYTGQNVGARKFDRIRKGLFYNILINAILVAVLAVVFFVFAKDFISMFLDSNASDLARNTGVEFLRIVTPVYFFMAMKFSSDGALRGLGRMNLFMLSTALDLVLRIIFSYILVIPFGARGIWLAIPVGWIIGGLLSFWFYKISIKKCTGTMEDKNLTEA